MVWLDKFTIRNLELSICPQHWRGVVDYYSDKTVTYDGVHGWWKSGLVLPLKEKIWLKMRIECVLFFSKSNVNLRNFRASINWSEIWAIDFQEWSGSCNPREVNSNLKALMRHKSQSRKLPQNPKKIDAKKTFWNQLHLCEFLLGKIDTDWKKLPLAHTPEAFIRDAVVILNWMSTEGLANSGKGFSDPIQKREMKIRDHSFKNCIYKVVFWLFLLEVTHAHKGQVPQEWIRKAGP